MSFRERMEGIINQGMSASRQMFDKARIKAKDLSEKGIVKYEIMQMVRQAENKLVQLGKITYDLLNKKGMDKVSKADTEINALLMEIEYLEKKIDAKEEYLKLQNKSDGNP